MDELIEKTMAALKQRGFKTEYAPDASACRELVLKMVPAQATVGVPGSATVRAVGLVEALAAAGHTVYDHWRIGLDLQETFKLRKAQLLSDVLITSVNALAATGELVSMDGIGNRVAAMIFGPGKVIIIAGRNKIAADLAAARRRVVNLAAPRRSQEMKLNNPCASLGECTDCNAPTRICRAEVILHRAPSLTPTTVVIVDEELGN